MSLKILVNLPTIQHGGILPPWLRIFKIFQSHGCDVFVNTGHFVKKLSPIGDVYKFQWLTDKEERLLSKDKTGTKMEFLFHSIRRNYITLKNSRKILGNAQFDVVYTPSAVLDFVIFPFYLKITGKRIEWATTLANVVPITDPGNKIARFLAWVFFRASLEMIKKANIIFASTPEIKKYLLKKKFIPEKIIETCFGVESDLINKARSDGKHKPGALFVGRINETKGIYDMLKVLHIVTQRYPDFQLAIMGDGDEKTKKYFKQKIRKIGLGNNINFLGYKIGMEKYNIIKSSKCFWFLSVSESESFGVALLEAVCSGLPAFAYDLPQFARMYKNGEVDISLKGDYKSVAEKVIKLFEKKNFSNEKGKLLLGKYSWESVAEIEYSAIKNLP